MCRPTFSCRRPIRPPKNELLQRATNFQPEESLEEELKTHHTTDDISSHPDYRTELQTLLLTYCEELLGIAGASGVKALRTSDP